MKATFDKTKHLNMKTKPIIKVDSNLISHCGFYCGACPKHLKDGCTGCRGDNPVCLKTCKVRPCNIENGYSTCAECTKYDNVRDCKDYNPFMIRFGQFITRTSRRKGIEMIKAKGKDAFVEFMVDRKWVTMKNK